MYIYKHPTKEHWNKYIKKILEDFKKDIDSNTIIVGDFHSLLSKKDRSSKQNINKDIVELNNVLDEMDLTDPKEAKYTFFSNTLWIFSKIEHNRTQNKPQQIQENWNHIKHFLQPQGTETRNQPQGKNPQNTQNHGDWIACL